MYRRSRSNSCHHTRGRGRRSHSPDSGGRKHGKEESKFSRKSQEVRSRSPRRNFWREEIKNIRSWKEENERGGERADRRSFERCSRDGGTTKISSRWFQKSNEEKPEESDAMQKYSHRKVWPSKEISPSSDKKRKDSRNQKSRSESLGKKEEKFLLSGRRGSLSTYRGREKSICINTATRGELGKLSSQVERSGLDRNQTQTPKKNVEMSRRDSPDSDELVLRISEKDIFPELREDWNDNKRVQVEASAKRKSSDQKVNNKPAKIELKNEEDIENTSSSRKSKLGKDELSPSNISVTKSLTSSDDPSNSTSSSSPLLDEKDSNTVMARRFSLVELEMEVFTTRLKELEWERKQLRREREYLQGQELCIRRNISKETKKKDKLTAEIIQLENGNKENKENQG